MIPVVIVGSCMLASKSEKAKPEDEIPELWQKLTVATKACDNAASQVSDALKSSGRSLDSYTAATTAHDICQQSFVDITLLSAPSSVFDEVEDEFDSALNNCRDAYFAKAQTMQETADALDKGMTFARLAEVKKLGDASLGGVLICALGSIGAANAAGVKLPDDKPAETKKS